MPAGLSEQRRIKPPVRRGFMLTILLIRLPEDWPHLFWPLFEFKPFFWLAVALPAIAAIWVGQKRSDARATRSGLALLCLLIAWIGISFLVATPRERLLSRQAELVRAAGHDHIKIVMNILSADVLFGSLNRAAIESELNSRLAEAHITGSYIRSATAFIHGRRAVTDIAVWTQTQDFGPVISNWQLSWRDHRRPGNWQVTHITLLRINNHKMPPGATIPSGP